MASEKLRRDLSEVIGDTPPNTCHDTASLIGEVLKGVPHPNTPVEHSLRAYLTTAVRMLQRRS